MSAQQLITDHLDLWTGAVTHKSGSGRSASGKNGKIELTGIKKLRELILELAVRGKLVPQSPEDTSFSELLLRLRKNHTPPKTRGRQTVSGEVALDEQPFNIPRGWAWTRLGETAEILDSQRKPITKSARKDGPYPYYGASGIVDYVNDYLFDEPLVLVGEDGAKWDKGEGTAFPISGKTWVNNHAHVLRPRREAITDEYLVYFLTAADLNQYITGMTVPKLNQARLSSIPVATPCLEEQHRIVEKVDELMALCDRLEQQVGNQLEAHEGLVDTLLDTLTRSADAAELAENWGRVAEHFDTLFTSEASIDKLKKTILQLAVMGQLVEQDPNDEPARVLLERIAEEKAQLAKDGKIKKPKRLPKFVSEDKRLTPSGWEAVRLGDLIAIRSELVKTKDHPELDQVAPDTIEKGTGRLILRRTVKESGAKGPNNKFYKGQILYSKIRPSLSKAVLAEFDGLCSADMYPINSFIHSRYLLLTMLSEPFLLQVRAAENRIKMPKLNIESLSSISVGLPPLVEQHRIVEKVDELMALCDRLKARLGEAGETRAQQAETVVEQAVS